MVTKDHYTEAKDNNIDPNICPHCGFVGLSNYAVQKESKNVILKLATCPQCHAHTCFSFLLNYQSGTYDQPTKNEYQITAHIQLGHLQDNLFICEAEIADDITAILNCLQILPNTIDDVPTANPDNMAWQIVNILLSVRKPYINAFNTRITTWIDAISLHIDSLDTWNSYIHDRITQNTLTLEDDPMTNTSVYLKDIMDISLLQQMLNENYVKISTSDNAPGLAILCYTSLTQYKRMWNNVTRNCRGLCITLNDNDFTNSKIMSRGIPKFFTLDGPDVTNTPDGIEIPLSDDTEDIAQTTRLTIRPTDPVHCADKIDGAMCVGYTDPQGNLRLHTKGAFESPEAIIGNQVLSRHGNPKTIAKTVAENYPNMSPIFEIVTPRINSKHPFIISYGNLEDLFLLGFVNITNGTWQPVKENDILASKFHFLTPETILDGTFEEMLLLPERKKKEGIVVTIQTETEQKLIKVKYQEFLELQRISLTQTAKINSVIERLLKTALTYDINISEARELCESTNATYLWLLDINNDIDDFDSLKRLSTPTVNLAQNIANTLHNEAIRKLNIIRIMWHLTDTHLANTPNNHNNERIVNSTFVDTILNSNVSSKEKNLAFATKKTYISYTTQAITKVEAHTTIIDVLVDQLIKDHKQDILQARGLTPTS